MKTTNFWLKAALHYLAAATGTFVAASTRPPENGWELTLLLVGSNGAGCVALKAYLSDANANRF